MSSAVDGTVSHHRARATGSIQGLRDQLAWAQDAGEHCLKSRQSGAAGPSQEPNVAGGGASNPERL